MSKNDRIHKLANAIREYRGARSEAHGKWIRPPKPGVIARVYRWMDELGIPRGDRVLIDNFNTVEEFHAWVEVTMSKSTSTGFGIGSLIAVCWSWATNHSVIWAFIHACFGWLYVFYRIGGCGE